LDFLNFLDMQKKCLKISSILLERASSSAFSSEGLTQKISWLLNSRENPISIDYINFSDALNKILEQFNPKLDKDLDILIKELNFLNILLPGNILPNGVLVLDLNFFGEIPKNLIKIEEIIGKIFSEENKFSSFNDLESFYIVIINPNDISKNFTRSFTKNEGFSDFSLEIIKEDELKEVLKDYFFLYSEINLEFGKDIEDDLMKNISFARFKDTEIIVPVDKEKNIKYFEMKTKSVNVNNFEIVKDKWKALLKQIKSDTKKVNFIF